MFRLKDLKTSSKITALFAIFNFASLIVLLISINIIYFFARYTNLKTESMYDMDINYSKYIAWDVWSNLEAFKEYILQKDTLIIPNDWWELICSNWVETKIHNDIEKIKDMLFYNNWEKIFFIYSQYYDDIWEVKVFFDTTPYVKSQILIIKISVLIIFFSIFLYFIIWRKISKYALSNLKMIANKTKDLDLENNFEEIEIIWDKDDEINILADALNKSLDHINTQAWNLKQFITDVSHEFKTPLMIINSKIDLYNKLREKNKDSKEELNKLLSSIKWNTKSLNNLIETLFNLSRVSEWIEEFNTKRVNLSEFICHNLDHYTTYLESKNLNFKYSVDRNVFMDIDKSNFNIVLENLLTNAIKFAKENTEIEVWLTNSKFYITNYWNWISKENKSKIWDKFYKDDQNKEWFWIGLFLVKRISSLYNWKIDVESIEGEKTTFIINFDKNA